MLYPETTNKKPNLCCTNEMNLEYHYGDAVEWEVYCCTICDKAYVVDIEIVRDFENMSHCKEDA